MNADANPNADGAAAEKARLRAGFRAWRAALAEQTWAEASARIVTRLLALPEVAAARTVHAYWPLVARREVDLRPLIEGLYGRGVRVVLPVVPGPGAGDSPRMTHRLYTGAAGLVENRWGLSEPVGTPEVAPDELDVVVVPALGAGRNGHRVGYGRGYYDAFLAHTRASAVCPVFAACLVDRVPPEPHDRPLDVVVTEREVVRVST